MTYRGHIKNGRVALDDPACLPEGAAVNVEIAESENGQPAIWKDLLELAGTVKGLPSDLAENLDHYLYGSPKSR